MTNRNSNNINIPEAREAMDKFKMEAASEVGVNLKNGYNGDLTSREAGSVDYPRNDSFPELGICHHAAHLTKNLRLVVVDYLGLVRSDERGLPIYERTTRNSNALKALARSLNVPVLCLCQLNRAAEQRADKTPSMADLRDSGAIEQDADAVILLHRPGMYEPGEVKPWEAQTLTAIVAKNRHGSTGKLNFDFYGSSGIIRERRLQTGGGL